MTRDEILAMQPGRALDVLVAARAMGWTHIVINDEYRGIYVGWPPDPRSWETEEGAYIPRYSQDGAAALQIIPIMAKRGWDCATYYEASTKRWTAYFLRDSHEDTRARAESDTLAEAVSKAALLALMEEAEDA